MSRARRTALATGLASAVVVVVAIGFVVATRRPPGRPAASPSKVPGIVLICLDTLRADVVEPGAEHGGMPTLAAFARGATRYRGAVAPSSWTAPSVTTILTGLEPWSHGVLDPSDGARLASSVPTLATTLRGAGWSTAACTGGGWVQRGSGLELGFEQFAADFDTSTPAAVVARWQDRRPTDRPFFLFLHTYAAHDPYGNKPISAENPCAADVEADAARFADALRASTPDAPDREALRRRFLEVRMTDPCRRRVLERDLGGAALLPLWAGCRELIDGGLLGTPDGAALLARIRASYLDSLRFVDARVAATLAALSSLPQGTVIVVCSDHGECLGEHGLLYHGRHVRPELTRAVLAIRAEGLPAGRSFDASCGLVDLAPTLLELAGVAPARPLDGRSLVPSAPDGVTGRPIASIVTSPPDGSGVDEPWVRRASVRDDRAAWTGTFDRRADGWVEESWFDLEADPGERAPRATAVAARDPAAFEQVRTRVRRAVELHTR